MRQWQNNFTGGEISRQAAGRWDLAFYDASAEIIENWFIVMEGGLTRTPGTRFVALSKVDGERVRLIPYRKSNEDVVCILAGAGYFRFYDGNSLQRLDGDVEVVTPFAGDDLEWIWHWQSTDVMFFTDKGGVHAPQILVRYDDDDWQLTDYVFIDGPFLSPNSASLTLTPSAVSGAITITASTPLFDNAHEGALFRLWTNNFSVPFEKWEPEEDPLSASSVRIYDGNVYQSGGSGIPSRSPPVHEEGVSSDGGTVTWNYLHDLAGTVEITNVASSTSASATVKSRLPATGATKSWAEGYLSDYRGWPYVGVNFGSRMYLAGSNSFPDTLWGSRIDGFNLTGVDFKQSKGSGEVNDDHAIVRTLNDSEANKIGSLIAGDQLFAFQANGVVRITGPSPDEPITPAGANAKRIRSAPGADFRCSAIGMKTDMAYISNGGAAVIALNPADLSFLTLSARARHVTESVIRKMVWLDAPWNRLVVLREDGRVFVCTFDREQSIVGWTRLQPPGTFGIGLAIVRDIMSLPGPDGREQLWWAVTRFVDGANVTMIERMEYDFNGDTQLPDEAVFGDAAVLLDNWNTDDKWVKLTHVDGKDAALRDAEVTIIPEGFTFAAGDVGKTLVFRRSYRPPQPTDVPGDIRVLLTAQSGTSATGTLLNDCPTGIYNQRTRQWGYASSGMAGLDHLEGETVGVWGDGVDLGDFTVSNGAIDFGGEQLMRACAGLRKTYRARSVGLVPPERDRLKRGDPIKLGDLWVDLLWTAIGEGKMRKIIDGKERESEEIRVRDMDDLMTATPDLRDGIVRVGPPGNAAKQVQIEVHGNGMGPIAIRAVGVDRD